MACPHRNELIQLNGDDLPSDRSESLFDHLENCEPCATVFEQLAESTNSLGEHLAGIPQKDIQKARIDKSRNQRVREKIAKRPGNDEHDARPETGPWESQYALSPGQKLEKYEIIRLLDTGGMGEVYEARHGLMGHHVAIKVIRGRHQDNPVAYQKFLTEMKTLARVKHPNLVRALDGGHEDGCLFVVMELLDGESLHTLCAEGKIGSAVEIIDAMLGLCRGLEQLHAHQLLHRDIKPANIMRLKDGTIKVIDLGLAADNVAGRQMSHVGAGTQGYMPPEQAYGSDSLNERSDIFSAGRVLKDLLRSLRDARANSNQTNAVSRLEKLAEWMTKLDMDDRPQSVKEVIVELKKLRRAMGKFARRWQTRSRPATAHPSVEERKRGRIFSTSGIWIAALIVTLVIVLAIWPDSSPAPSNANTDQTAGSEVVPQPPPAAIAPFDAVQAKSHQTTWANHLGTPVETTNSIGMNLKLIPPGEFMMGSRLSAVEVAKRFEVPVGLSLDEHPRHRVKLTQPFYLGVTEVTKGQFGQFVLAESYRTEAETDGKGGYGWPSATGLPEQNPKYNWKNCGFAQTDDHPVVNLSWNDAQAFFKWLSAKEGVTYRLPTEAEWEYACRAGTTTMYQTGDDPEGLVSVGNAMDASAKAKFTEFPASFFLKASDGYAFMAPVGGFRANPWGLHDMQGNVTEWCQDWAGEYPSGDVTDPMGAPQGEGRVLRGGSFLSLAMHLRSADRLTTQPVTHDLFTGFRAARTYR